MAKHKFATWISCLRTSLIEILFLMLLYSSPSFTKVTKELLDNSISLHNTRDTPILRRGMTVEMKIGCGAESRA
ncbi:hypothetical protein SAMN04488028_102572 [Reichenbachiella agariperforans]|uniref:Uncharacterized protein n=1 Tax=Reichenbachiella agariperforans TaxID=156994 RepID=A0A1M6P6Z6_REIAG|nr:hypothetical protein SAMN04488028_102572 [Reichenbachiella agariperforans]